MSDPKKKLEITLRNPLPVEAVVSGTIDAAGNVLSVRAEPILKYCGAPSCTSGEKSEDRFVEFVMRDGRVLYGCSKKCCAEIFGMQIAEATGRKS